MATQKVINAEGKNTRILLEIFRIAKKIILKVFTI